MKNTILKLVLFLFLLPFLGNAQTLKIDTAEKLFKWTKPQLVDSLKAKGFKNLSDEEVFEEEFANSSNGIQPNTKEKLYTKTGLKKCYELRKIVYGGECKLSILMKEPNCKTVDRIYWNANLRMDAGYYVRKLDAMGYVKVIENNLEKYINKEKGFVIILKISQRTSEITFSMSRIT